ncbi:MAG: alcohol dehydrogenase catalytic domain-containing protein [bacterium]|nr:alcohol dehydrogenase catalytic domain-containing protein [bacterium]
MKVAACDDDGSVRIVERDVPSPARGELLLRLRWCGLCGTDLFKLNNKLPAAGTVLGHEIVGEVVERGEGVVAFNLGDRVLSPHHVACGVCRLCRRGASTKCAAFLENLLEPGGFSEFVLVRARAVRAATWRVPDHITDAAASFLEPAACVLRGIDRAKLTEEPGAVVIMGAGSMGLLHLLVLQSLMPEWKVIVCDPIRERLEFARGLGAITCDSDPVKLRNIVDRLTDCLGADAVFDTVGGSGPLRTGVSALRPGGTAVLFAHGAEAEPAGFELNPFFKGEQRVVGSYSGGLDEQRRIADLIFRGKLDASPLVTDFMPLARINAAVKLTREHKALKILLGPEVW